MKFSEVLESDMKMAGQMVNMLQSAEYSLNGKDVCASADTIRWFQKHVVAMAESYAQSKISDKKPSLEHEAPAAANPERSLLGADVKMKAFNPGKMGKK